MGPPGAGGSSGFAYVGFTTSVLPAGGVEDFELTLGSLYNLVAISSDSQMWIRVYGDPVARAADTRTSPGGTPPLSGTGFYAEAVTTTAEETITFAPLPVVYTGTGLTYFRVVNMASSPQTLELVFKTVEIVPSPGSPSDPYWNDVSLLLQMTGVNGSTTFIDSSANATPITPYGGAQISTAISKWGDGSGSFNGSTAYLDTTTQGPFILAGDFTVETWIYLNTAPAVYATIFCSTPPGTSAGNYRFGVYNVAGTLRLNAGFNIGGFTGTTTSVTANTWTHVALVRNSGVISCFVNGIKDATTFAYSATIIPNPDLFDRPIFFGKDEMFGSTGNHFNGHMNDFRITKNIARYTTNFTPPLNPFPVY